MSVDYLILIVEDTVEFAKLSQMILGRIGLQTHHAVDGDEAVTFIEHTRPDLVLLDLNLPGKSGWQVLESLYERYGDRSVPIIVTTAYSDGANRVIGKLQDVEHYLVKPFPPKVLQEAVQNALGLGEAS